MSLKKEVRVFFPILGKELTVSSEMTIAEACDQVGYSRDLVCGSNGSCKKCQVNIEVDGEIKTVLSCKEKVFDGLKIMIENEKQEMAMLSEKEIYPMEVLPSLQKMFIGSEQLQTPECSGDWDNICMIAGLPLETPNLNTLRKISSLIREKDLDGITLTVWNNEVLDIERNDTLKSLYGLAIDIGTTSVVCYLFDMNKGKKLGVYSSLNEQTSIGGDVISRIGYCIENNDGLDVLQSKISSTINGLIESAVEENAISPSSIYEIVISGNATMQHLFLGLNPENLGLAPFNSVIQKEVIVRPDEVGLKVHPNAVIEFLPLIGGFVGADTTSVVTSLAESAEEFRLIIDIGTNGEIVVGKRGKYLATSAAAGPALEGADIRFGMRGSNGAIERVVFESDCVTCTVIGNQKPVGICGSGLIDIVAELLRVGIINNRGRLLTEEEFLAIAESPYAYLADRLCFFENEKAFRLTDHFMDRNAIYITQKDIRNVQLAKAAIYTACMILLKEYGIMGEQLNEILVTGAFGNYIDVEKGQQIGLLPKFDNVPVKAIGNAAGLGVQKHLLSKQVKAHTRRMVKKIEHVELASKSSFNMEYIGNTSFACLS